MDLHEPVIRQCEQGFVQNAWASPLLAAANIAFLVTAFAGLNALRRRRQTVGMSRDLECYGLIGLTAGIGLASGLFQVFGTRWSRMLDIAAIGAFATAYAGVAMWRLMGATAVAATCWVALFVAMSLAASRAVSGDGSCLNGTLSYVPALVGLSILSFRLWRNEHPGLRPMLAGAAVFATALLVRYVGLEYCAVQQLAWIGIMSLAFWLILMAAVIWLLIQCLTMRHGPDGRRRGWTES